MDNNPGLIKFYTIKIRLTKNKNKLATQDV